MPPTTKPALLRVRVHLLGSNPEIWRLIEIDADLRLDQVHAALQTVMGWEDAHLHEFQDHAPYVRQEPDRPEPRRWGPEFLRDNDHVLLAEEDYTLRDVLSEDGPLFYEYDLGDSWTHCLTLIETLPKAPTDNAVTVIRGERACPLEDSGGIGGYEDLLTAITDPTHEYHHEQSEWVEEMTGAPASSYDPTAFDKNATNRLLRKQFPATQPGIR